MQTFIPDRAKRCNFTNDAVTIKDIHQEFKKMLIVWPPTYMRRDTDAQ